MFERLKLFTVYTKTNDAGEAEDVQLVRVGFSFWAFLFNMFWAVYHRLWLFAALCIAIFFFTEALATRDWLSNASVGVIQIGAYIIIGMLANDERRRVLEKRGYVESDVVGGISKARAELRYYDRLGKPSYL